jgi:FtsH-binding integral membrane protein
MELKNQVTDNIAMTTLIGLLGIIMIGVYNTAFKKGHFTCHRYILNTYLYILMALVIICLEVLSFDLYKIDLHRHLGGVLSFVILLVVVLGVLWITMFINPRNVLLKHASWFLFTLIMGYLAYPAYLKSKDNNTLMSVLLSLVSILVVFSLVVFINPDFVSFKWGPILFFILVGVIITHIVFLLTLKKRNKKQNTNYVKGVSYFIIVLFIFFIMYDTKKIIVAAKHCKESTVDYINQSLGIVIDALNIFQSLANISG